MRGERGAPRRTLVRKKSARANFTVGIDPSRESNEPPDSRRSQPHLIRIAGPNRRRRRLREVRFRGTARQCGNAFHGDTIQPMSPARYPSICAAGLQWCHTQIGSYVTRSSTSSGVPYDARGPALSAAGLRRNEGGLVR